MGSAAGLLPTPARYASGATQPVAVLVGDFVAGPTPDLAVGHADGTLTLLEGDGQGTFQLRPESTVTGLGTIADLTAADLDGDGDTDLAVSGTGQLTLLLNDNDPLTTSPLANGDFSQGLTGWRTEIVGHASGATTGSISALGGFAQLRENQSFLVSLQQTFVVPPTPQQLSLDIVSLALDDPNGGVPDALEISLLADDLRSLVPTFSSQATSFFNVNPGTPASLGPGVTFDGTTVTLDISGLAAGTQATLYVDLVGNPPGSSSVVSVDNVRVTPETIYTNTFSAVPLAGPFVATAAIAHGDVDGDGHGDLVAADRGAGKLLVYNGDGSGHYERSELDLTAYGSGPLGVAIGPLSAGDTTDDVAVTLFDSARALTPLGADTTGPSVTFVNPAPGELLTTDIAQLVVQFSEAVQDHGPTGGHSVTNPQSYLLVNHGPNGTFDNGSGDDLAIPIDSVTYNAHTFETVLTLASAALPLPDGRYQLQVEGDDAGLAIWDKAGNALGGGVDATATFAVNTPPAGLTLVLPRADEGQSLPLSAGYSDPGYLDSHTATVWWGDGSSSLAAVDEAAATISAAHVYADNGIYNVRVEITDSAGSTAEVQGEANIANVLPRVSPAAAQIVNEDELLSLVVATFTDPGFTSAIAGTSETFTATIDWGDGSAPSR